MQRINGYPFNNLYNMKTHDRLNELDGEIAKEEATPNADSRKINRLREQKLIEGLFSTDQLGMTYGKYRSPW